MYPKKDNAFSLLGGAILGAAAMYLLDPDAGERRRRELAERSGDAASHAGEALGPMWDRVSDTARTFGSSIATGASAFGSTAAERFADARSRASSAASDAADKLTEHASSLGERASDVGSSLADSFRHFGRHARDAAAAPAGWFHHEEESHVGRYAATGLGTLVLGAAAMYLLDPQRGRSRRARILDQASSIVRQTGRSACQLGKDLRNRGMGYAHEAKGYFEPEDAVSAERLLQRIRSEIGHVTAHSGAIQVMTDNQGRVTLHGKVLASEADRLLSTVKGVSGVNEVINLLSVKETEQQMSEAMGGGQPATQL
jgi:gas vesicle protein